MNDCDWYIQDVRTGFIDGFYAEGDMAEDVMLRCVRKFKRWMVLKQQKPNETIDDFIFWDEGYADWYEDWLHDTGYYSITSEE